MAIGGNGKRWLEVRRCGALSVRYPAPCLKEERGDDQCKGILQVLPDGCDDFRELCRSYQLSLENPVPRILHEVEEQHSTLVTWRVYVHQWIDTDVEHTQLAQHARHAETNGSIDSVELGVGVQYLQEAGLVRERRIASRSRRIRFV